MSYLKYANIAAEVVRASLKEPFLSKVRRRGPTRRLETFSLSGPTHEPEKNTSEGYPGLPGDTSTPLLQSPE